MIASRSESQNCATAISVSKSRGIERGGASLRARAAVNSALSAIRGTRLRLKGSMFQIVLGRLSYKSRGGGTPSQILGFLRYLKCINPYCLSISRPATHESICIEHTSSGFSLISLSNICDPCVGPARSLALRKKGMIYDRANHNWRSRIIFLCFLHGGDLLLGWQSPPKPS